MKSKKLICGAVAVAITMTATFTGCVTINEKDMKQTIATVDITKSQDLGDLAKYSSAITEDVIVKRQLVAAFINAGSSYISAGYSYADTFNLLVESLIANSAVTQYTILYVLKEKSEAGEVTLEEYNKKDTEAAKLEYLLGGENSEGVKTAKYQLYSSLNSLLDSYEKDYLTDEDEYTGTDTRTTPGNVDTQKEDYLPLKEDGTLDYYVYTGYGDYLLKDAGVYEPQDGTNKNTRRKAYSTFVSYLKSNYLLTSEDKDTTDILSLTYVQDEYVSQLQQSVIEEFSDMYNEAQQKIIDGTDENGVYTFIKDKYDGVDGLYTEQSKTYSTTSTFETALNNLSDTSFVLYAPDTTKDTEEINGTYGTYGYVYNILLPFSTAQQSRLNEIQSSLEADIITDNDYYADRNDLLKSIVTTDQRSAWFNGETDYSFNAKEAELDYYGKDSGRDYLFFENNLTKPDEYETLTNYIGLYSYNGSVSKNTDGSYKLIANKLNIDDMLGEFESYLEYVLGGDKVEIHAGDTLSGSTTDFIGYYATKDFTKDGDDKEIDYSKFVYATGKVSLENTDKDDMYVETSDRYKAMAAVNELQFAYTTDTAILSQYLGYSISAYETSYIKEFEYAAQQALRMGTGAFKVCAGDYGWHLIYVVDAFSFEGGEVYTPEWTKERIETEGTFENKFYEWIKESTLSDEVSSKRSEIIQTYSNDTTVTKYENAYKDLLEIEG